MSHQAVGLRARTSGASRRPWARRDATPAFVVGSGKGGVGKSVLSILLAGALVRSGRRVLLADAAHNQANLHILLGQRPTVGLGAVIEGHAEPEQLLMPVGERLWLLPGDSGAEALYGLNPIDRARLQHRLSSVYDDFEAVVVDAGPGLESALRATLGATRLVVVAVPEPAALSDAYALIKIVSLQLPSLPVGVLVNRAGSEEEGRSIFDRLELAAHRFLRRRLDFVGIVAEDPALGRLVRHPGALLAQAPVDVEQAAARLLDLESAPAAEPGTAA
jgi:flagellar biosynthesis protein FlhG